MRRTFDAASASKEVAAAAGSCFLESPEYLWLMSFYPSLIKVWLLKKISLCLSLTSATKERAV
jgi:hypothetical protein